jgi:hypothetical protein
MARAAATKGHVSRRNLWPVLLLAACGNPPAFLDNRRVEQDEACSRLEAAVRRKCPPDTAFNCSAYYQQGSQDCGGPQRETDVARCEDRVDRARTCDEALDTTCGMACPAEPWWPW